MSELSVAGSSRVQATFEPSGLIATSVSFGDESSSTGVWFGFTIQMPPTPLSSA
jgi:hypothetical protein